MAVRTSTPALKSKPERQDLEQLYVSLQKSQARLIGSDGKSRELPGSLRAFLVHAVQYLEQGHPLAIINDNAEFTTIEGANILGVSRQFLVNLLEGGEIPHHLVGTHRRIYSRDLFAYKAQRDNSRRKLLRELTKAEVEEGLYHRTPLADADPG